MTPTRRRLLRAGGVALAGGLAGCVYNGPFPATSLTVSVGESFASGPPTAVPLSVEVFVQNVDSKDVALRGVELVACDADREPTAERRLGEFAWRDADPDRRDSEEHDAGVLSTQTAYHANWTVEHTFEVGRVPEWLTVRVEEVWFGGEEEANALVAGGRRPSLPPPEFQATVRRFEGERPPPATVAPGDYAAVGLTSRAGVGSGEPLLPEPTPTPSAENGTATSGPGNRTATEGPANRTVTEGVTNRTATDD